MKVRDPAVELTNCCPGRIWQDTVGKYVAPPSVLCQTKNDIDTPGGSGEPTLAVIVVNVLF